MYEVSNESEYSTNDIKVLRPLSPPISQLMKSQDVDNTKSPGMRHRINHSESDVAAGLKVPTLMVINGNEHTDSQHSRHLSAHHVLVLGVDISHLSRSLQFAVCAGGVFAFTLVYGYLQELISVQLLNRKIGLFLAFFQFVGYVICSFILRVFVHKKSIATEKNSFLVLTAQNGLLKMYIGISLLRAFDLGMTNMAMQYINYPAKTLLKSSKTLWTMLFGLLIVKKRYSRTEYAAVLLMVAGLALFLHADATSSAVFEPLGILMLIASLMSDGIISNLSESLMSTYNVCQDEYIFCMYSLSTIVIFVAALAKGHLLVGVRFLMMPGTIEEIEAGLIPTWSVGGKLTVMILFSTFGFFGSSCSAAITKHFGALAMSITSTARKAATLFFSFLLFPNNCTVEHVFGIALFTISMIMKSLKKGKKAMNTDQVLPYAQHFPVNIV